jgi:outer membrane protein OmpA-like peptidoglycan-associated protein
MKKWSSLVLGGVVLALGSAGCATKGYVKEQIGGLRQDMEASDSDLSTRIDDASSSSEEAMARAEAAFGAADGNRDLALGKAGFREADHHQVFFKFDSAELSAESQETLSRVAQEIADNPHYLVDLYGYTDPTGDPNYNLTLGHRRADNVLRYLIENTPGQLSRFQSVSFGEMVPASETAANNEQRRQVVISLVERIPLEQQESLSQN